LVLAKTIYILMSLLELYEYALSFCLKNLCFDVDGYSSTITGTERQNHSFTLSVNLMKWDGLESGLYYFVNPSQNFTANVQVGMKFYRVPLS
jgi:hypothetical protein